MARPSFDDAWALLKQVPQIDLTDAERQFVPMARAGGAKDARNLQSNLGLFDPALAVQTVGSNFEPQQIRIGRGQPAPRAPQIESEFITPYAPGDHTTSGGFKLMGVPAGGGKPVQMSKVSGLTRRKHPIDGGFSHFQLGGLGGATPPEFRRQGNYEKLMRAILSQGIGIQSTNRNPMSNPFHRKFSGKTGDMYNVSVDGERRDDVEDKDIRGGSVVNYEPPMIRGKDGGIITQRPIGAPPGEGFPHGEPEGGFGSLARYDFGALPFRRNLDFESIGEKLRGDDPNTEQTLLAEAVLANMNRRRNTPMSMHDMLFEGGRMGQREMMRYGDSPMRGEMRGRVDELPSPSSGGGLKYALGFNTPHRPLISDEKTGDPLLLVQPQGRIAQRINDEIRERERQKTIAYQEKMRQEEEERQRMVESLLPNAGDLSDPANAPMMAAIQELIRRQARQTALQQATNNDDDWIEELGSLFS